MKSIAVMVVSGMGLGCSAQQLLWEVHSVASSSSAIMDGTCAPTFEDYNRDGVQDLLVLATDFLAPLQPALIRILSGKDGSMLDAWYVPYPGVPTGYHRPVGDWDGDGHADLAFFKAGGFVEVWSIVGRTLLRQIPTLTCCSFDGEMCGDLDLDGDSKVDLLFTDNGQIRAFDNSGAPLYAIPALVSGLNVFGLGGVGDVDGDGCDDFVAAGPENWSGASLGAAVLFSGRTGLPLRVHFGAQPFALLNRDVRSAGDVDGDGVLDYAVGNNGGFCGLVMIWSGATGALLRQWLTPVGQFGGAFVAGEDIDLDGRPDIASFAGGYPNVPGGLSNTWGRVRTFSARDGQELPYLASQPPTNQFGVGYGSLGVQPGNPYPVFVVMDVPAGANGYARIRAYSWAPAGTSFVGAGCTGTSTIPTIGIRPVDATPTNASRLVLGSAPPQALAICVAAPANMTSAGGIATPWALDFLGLTGCQLLVPPAILHATVTGSVGMDRGYAAFDFPQTMVAAGGTLFAAQWIVLDPTTLHFATTARYEFRAQ